jgi:NitT/TauT family transport system substrate-binding protein
MSHIPFYSRRVACRVTSARIAIGVLAFVAAVSTPLTLSATGAAESAVAEDLPLVVGLMPAVDSIPLLVADAAGLFADHGVAVDLEVFRDQLSREAALQANTIDATVSDLINAIRAWDNGADYRVIAATDGRFTLVTAPESAITSIETWPSAPTVVPTGLLEDSIIRYTAERMLAAAGADSQRIEIVPTVRIPVRLEMVLAGELEAAVLPEPIARLAVAGGANHVIDSSVLPATPGVLLATGKAIREKADALAALLFAYDEAVALLGDDPEAYRSEVVAAGGFPGAVEGLMELPAYRPAALPSAELVADVASWMIGHGLINEAPSYEAVTVEFGRR